MLSLASLAGRLLERMLGNKKFWEDDYSLYVELLTRPQSAARLAGPRRPSAREGERGWSGAVSSRMR